MSFTVRFYVLAMFSITVKHRGYTLKTSKRYKPTQILHCGLWAFLLPFQGAVNFKSSSALAYFEGFTLGIHLCYEITYDISHNFNIYFTKYRIGKKYRLKSLIPYKTYMSKITYIERAVGIRNISGDMTPFASNSVWWTEKFVSQWILATFRHRDARVVVDMLYFRGRHINQIRSSRPAS